MNQCFPFSAIVGQDQFKLALLLCMVDPSIGGVLAMGDKGTGKTTTVRALSQLLGKFPFVNLPIGATEDRVLGSIKLETLINDKKIAIEKGLLNRAHGGILYIDEVNLLDDFLMDSLLDAAAMDGYYLERDNISEWLPSKFILVGTMNAEEGELRPQLLDRFGLSVFVDTPVELADRKQIVKNRLSFDENKISFIDQYKYQEENLRNQIINARGRLSSLKIEEEVYDYIAQLCNDKKVEGLRADILLVKTARAFATYREQTKVSCEDVKQIQELVLGIGLNSLAEINQTMEEAKVMRISKKKIPKFSTIP